jgi:hypothetical protein
MRRDHLTNSCYIPCEDWEWKTKTEQKINQAAIHLNNLASIISLIVIIVTWIKLKHL